jgi:hypothetical protein
MDDLERVLKQAATIDVLQRYEFYLIYISCLLANSVILGALSVSIFSINESFVFIFSLNEGGC